MKITKTLNRCQGLLGIAVLSLVVGTTACQDDLLFGESAADRNSLEGNQTPRTANAAKVCDTGDETPRPIDTNDNSIFRTEDRETFVFLDDVLTLHDEEGQTVWSVPCAVDVNGIMRRTSYEGGIVFSHKVSGNIHLTRIDNTGVEIWTVNLGEVVNSLEFEGAAAHTITVGLDGSVIVVMAAEENSTLSTIAASYNADDGELVWSVSHAETGITPFDSLVRNDGSLLVVGGASLNSSDVLLLDEEGRLISQTKVIEQVDDPGIGSMIFPQLRKSTDGSVYIVGQFLYGIAITDGAESVELLQARVQGGAAHSAMFISRFNANLMLEWAVSGYTEGDTGTAYNGEFRGNDDGGITVWGAFDGEMVLNRGEEGATLLTGTYGDAFWARFTADGVLENAEIISNVAPEAVFIEDESITIDKCEENEELDEGLGQCVFLEFCITE